MGSPLRPLQSQLGGRQRPAAVGIGDNHGLGITCLDAGTRAGNVVERIVADLQLEAIDAGASALANEFRD